MPPSYRIETLRLVLRCWNPTDAPLLLDTLNASAEHLKPWMFWAADLPDPNLEKRLEHLRTFRGKFDLGQDFVYGIFNPSETAVIGNSGLHTRLGPLAREIGYWVGKDFINQGFATEAAAALTRVAFEVDRVERVEIHCDELNLASAAVPRKLGYSLDATLRQRRLNEITPPRNLMVWSMLASEFPGSPAQERSASIVAYDVLDRRLI